MSKSNVVRDRLVEEFVKALNQDEIPWRAMWTSQRAYNATTGKSYRGVNALWLAYQAQEKNFSDPRWCTYKQCQDNGWQVRKGEKGTHVEFWSIYDTKAKKTITIAEANKIVSSDEERKDDMRVTARLYTVFNAAQIDGIPELQQQTAVNIESIRGQRDILLRNMGLAFHEGGDQAFYRPSEDSVTMPPDTAFKNDYGYMSVFLHECGHATGHESRLNRDLSGHFGSESYAKEELRAEIASAFTSQALGFSADAVVQAAHMENHKAYIQSWARAIKDAPNELFAAIKDAEAISDYLIEKGEFERLQAAEVLEADSEKAVVDELLLDAAKRSNDTKSAGKNLEREGLSLT